MAINTHITQTAIDFQGLAELRRSANADGNDEKTIAAVAGQFESLFTAMMLKSMRDASLAQGLFDNSQSQMYRDIADQQLAIELSANSGLGLKEAIIRQLTQHTGSPVTAPTKSAQHAVDATAVARAKPSLTDVISSKEGPKAHSSKQSSNSVATLTKAVDITFDSPASFIKQLAPLAKQAAAQLGVSAELILAQAALETGWGNHVIKQSDGRSSHNLFNIKAGNSWQGETVTKNSLEYHNGAAVKEQAKFRAYDSYQQSFADYVDFLQSQPRYQPALTQAADPEQFIEAIHQAGYATDPDYANKVKQIMASDNLAYLSQASEHS